MQNCIIILSISVMLVVGGCMAINQAIPPGYDLDLTPDNNGETWR